MATLSGALKRGLDDAAARGAAILALLLAVAVLTRAARIGDPAIHMDEQFYLLVADRMWHGALPYVDIWDRKPILLFLIYAALRPFSADGIVAYQIGALLFATATAYFIVLIARRYANAGGAVLAGVAYLLYLPLLSGAGGQSPVFYNLFMAIGAWETIRAGEATASRALWHHGLRAMLWVGLAIQIKYTAAIEGLLFGLWLTALLVRRDFASPGRAVLQIALWALTALAPTLLAALVYALIGHGRDFVAANFLSIFQVREPSGFLPTIFLVPTVEKLVPLFLFTGLSGLRLARAGATDGPRWFLLLWCGFAIAGVVAIGNFYDHYALPLLVPAAIVCAPLLGTAAGGAIGIGVAAVLAVIATDFPHGDMRALDQSRVAAMVEAARPYAARGCIYINDGPTIVYLLAHSCLPSRYVFPEHLNNAAEARATDASRSMAELLARRPAAILVPDRPLHHPRNPATAALLDAALERDYVEVATLPDLYPPRQQVLYARKDLLP